MNRAKRQDTDNTGKSHKDLLPNLAESSKTFRPGSSNFNPAHARGADQSIGKLRIYQVRGSARVELHIALPNLCVTTADLLE